MTEPQREAIKKAICEHEEMLHCPHCNRGFYDFTEGVCEYFIYEPSRTNAKLIGIICDCGYVSFYSAKKLGVTL